MEVSVCESAELCWVELGDTPVRVIGGVPCTTPPRVSPCCVARCGGGRIAACGSVCVLTTYRRGIGHEAPPGRTPHTGLSENEWLIVRPPKTTRECDGSLV